LNAALFASVFGFIVFDDFSAVLSLRAHNSAHFCTISDDYVSSLPPIAHVSAQFMTISSHPPHNCAHLGTILMIFLALFHVCFFFHFSLACYFLSTG
jgi:hypothetical protein